MSSAYYLFSSAITQQHLRNVLAYHDVPMLGQPEAFIHVKDGLFDEAENSGVSLSGYRVNKYLLRITLHSTSLCTVEGGSRPTFVRKVLFLLTLYTITWNPPQYLSAWPRDGTFWDMRAGREELRLGGRYGRSSRRHHSQ
jgi:hypothetical protein